MSWFTIAAVDSCKYVLIGFWVPVKEKGKLIIMIYRLFYHIRLSSNCCVSHLFGKLLHYNIIYILHSVQNTLDFRWYERICLVIKRLFSYILFPIICYPSKVFPLFCSVFQSSSVPGIRSQFHFFFVLANRGSSGVKSQGFRGNLYIYIPFISATASIHRRCGAQLTANGSCVERCQKGTRAIGIYQLPRSFRHGAYAE